MNAKLQLPLNGKWLVYWGGDNKEQNHHHGQQFENYAIDFVRPSDMESTPKDIEETQSVGENVIAVAAGVVVRAIVGFADNPIGQWDEYNIYGNYLIIQHKEEVYSIYAHLQANSVKVVAGDEVTAGQVIAKVGNSGRTTQPHLHFGLQSVGGFQKAIHDSTNYSLKPYFDEVIVDGHNKRDYSPVKDEVVSNG